jgi:hypothetical protein
MPDQDDREVQSARLSFRATARNFEKLVAIAKAKDWINAKGQPNVSAVLNYLVEMFDLAILAPKKSSRKDANKKGKTNDR